ncbi:Single-stranded nucleic acid binding R3H [Metarhizium rileyi]|uniref:Protein SQS1 n=1 Tax=Metarhizium rileyi (strain RCEF 4871) TaxID=1649241 RepID=A0A167IWD3_METRR|nr:Single-stranded nucleic acid binding R3H [Metarhizium rileyi RCEF 4871]
MPRLKNSSRRPWKTGNSSSAKHSEASSSPKLPENGHTSPPIASATFTLAEEASRTSLRDHGFWTEETKLRKNPVPFISAGQPDEKTVTKRSLQVQETRTSSPPDFDENLSQHYCRLSEESQSTFYFDISGYKTSNCPHSSQSMTSKQPSSPDSSSSKEVILFRGRKKWKQQNFAANNFVQDLEDDCVAGSPHLSSSADDEYLYTNSRFPRNRKRPGRKLQNRISNDDIAVDYINNMRANGELDSSFSQIQGNQRDLGASDTEAELSCSDADAEHNKIQDVTRKARERMPQQRKNYASSVEGASERTAITKDEVTLVKLIAAQDLSSSSNIVADTQTSEPDGSNTHFTKRHAATKQDQFDLIGRSTANLRLKKGKRYSSQLSFHNYGLDIDEQLEVAWKNDRLRKKERKRLREELRSSGMLRKAANPDDLGRKYPSGMSIEQVGEELEAFLRNRNEVLLFPPMDLHARKIIHELANGFNIKSKSNGKANQRRPVLYRTNRTLPYAELPFTRAMGRIQRRFLPRLDAKGKRNHKALATHLSHGAASYREGEVVGASAPELGVSNRGRAILEKMGWSRGTALGAVDNKGILQPVPQTMKNSKAGLR